MQICGISILQQLYINLGSTSEIWEPADVLTLICSGTLWVIGPSRLRDQEEDKIRNDLTPSGRGLEKVHKMWTFLPYGNSEGLFTPVPCQNREQPETDDVPQSLYLLFKDKGIFHLVKYPDLKEELVELLGIRVEGRNRYRKNSSTPHCAFGRTLIPSPVLTGFGMKRLE
jgi:hypothetical protein